MYHVRGRGKPWARERENKCPRVGVTQVSRSERREVGQKKGQYGSKGGEKTI